MRVLFLTVLALLIVPVVYGGDDAYEFKGIKLGSDIKELVEKPEIPCEFSKDTVIADEICRVRGTIGGTPLKSGLLYYYSDKLHSISLTVKASDFDQVVAAMKEKYGKPTDMIREPVQTRAGVTYQNQKYIWQNKTSSITVEKYAGTIDRSHITYHLNSYLDEFTKRSKQKAKSGADDL